MSTVAQLDFTPIRERFAARLELRLITISEHFVALEQKPGSRLVGSLMREFHSLSGTAGTLGFGALSDTAASAEQTCQGMMDDGRYDQRSDLAMLEEYINEIGQHVARAGGSDLVILK